MVTAVPPTGGLQVDGSVTMSITVEGYRCDCDDRCGPAVGRGYPPAIIRPTPVPLRGGSCRFPWLRRPTAAGGLRRPGPRDLRRSHRAAPGRAPGLEPRAFGHRWVRPPGRD